MRVLVVEDNPAVGDSIARMLEARRYAANVVTDGVTGLDHLVSRNYDVAVVDVGLPGIDGFTLARNARAAGVQTPILMLTARDAVEDRVAGLECGADDYLVEAVRRRRAHRSRRGDTSPRRPPAARRARSRGAARGSRRSQRNLRGQAGALGSDGVSALGVPGPQRRALRSLARTSSSVSGITTSTARATSSTSTSASYGESWENSARAVSSRLYGESVTA